MSDNRLLILLAYDVSDQKALSKVRRSLKPFAISGQKSFYECWVTPSELRELTEEIKDIINPDTDRVHLFELHECEFSLFLGEARRQSIEPFLII